MRMKAKQAALYLGISVRYLHQLSQQGRIPYRKISPRCLIYESTDLDLFMDGCRIA
jgi:predicted site-specific integrase-resolvase